MRKTLNKNYPKFDEADFINDSYGRREHWFRKGNLPPVPSRFGKVYRAASIGRREENFIAFGSSVEIEETAITTQEAYFKYERPVILNHRDQLKGRLPEGDVDFNIEWKFLSLESGDSVQDPNTGRGVRYPFTIATYFPIRNILLIRDITNGRPTESLDDLISWIFEKVSTVAYKHTKHGPILIGCDPEFNILNTLDERISASSVIDDPECKAPLGVDGSSSIGELRPSPADCPLKLTEKVKDLMKDLSTKLESDMKIVTGGGGNLASIGHHIHFNKMVVKEEKELLDDFVGAPSLKIKGSKRPSSDYGRVGDIRRQPHGCEYRTPASSLIPELTNALHTTAFCCVLKWQSMREDEHFNYDVDDDTKIPTLEAYRSLDVTEDKRYTPHLEEFWKWVNGVDGREIDPTRDCLYRWVDGRKEVKPTPGLKIAWDSHLFPRSKKEKFMEMEELGKIYALSVLILRPLPNEETEDKMIQLSITPEEQKKLNSRKPTVQIRMGEKSVDSGWCAEKLEQINEFKTKYGIDYIDGFDQGSLSVSIPESITSSFRTVAKLKSFVKDLAKIICIPA